jgi:hypothetical protein
VFLTLILLLRTILKSRQHQIQAWKSSGIAALSVLSGEARDQLGGVRSVGNMKDKAKDIRPVLRKSDKGWMLEINN